MQMTPKSFSDSYFNSLFSCFPFCCNKMFSVSFLSLSRLYFSLQDFCLARVTARFLLIFKGCCQTYCQTNKQIKAGGKNNSCVTIEWKVFCLSCDSKDCKHYTSPFKTYKSSVKESRRLRNKCDWLQWTMYCRQSCM